MKDFTEKQRRCAILRTWRGKTQTMIGAPLRPFGILIPLAGKKGEFMPKTIVTAAEQGKLGSEGGMKVIVSFSHLITLAKAEATARLAIPYNEEAFLKAQREHDEYVEVCLKADGMMIPQ